jgi:hypothetical protein
LFAPSRSCCAISAHSPLLRNKCALVRLCCATSMHLFAPKCATSAHLFAPSPTCPLVLRVLCRAPFLLRNKCARVRPCSAISAHLFAPKCALAPLFCAYFAGPRKGPLIALLLRNKCALMTSPAHRWSLKHRCGHFRPHLFPRLCTP